MINGITIADVVNEMNERYRDAIILLSKQQKIQKGDRGKIFSKIIQSLFEKYKEQLGYNFFSNFKSDILFTQKNMKKNKKRKDRTFKMSSEEEIISCPHKPEDKEVTEGSGQVFTQKQIEDFDLNEDSY